MCFIFFKEGKKIGMQWLGSARKKIPSLRIWGWGFKNIHLFGQALAARRLWRFFKGDGMWHQIM